MGWGWEFFDYQKRFLISSLSSLRDRKVNAQLMKRLKILGEFHRYRLDRHISSLLMAIAIGILSGYGAVLFRFVIQGAQYAFYQNTEDILTFVNTVPVYGLIGLPALGGLVVGLLVRFGAREAKGHGVPEVMEAVSLRGGRIRKRVAFVKIIASAVCIGSGGSVGREGPIVQIGSSIGSSIAQIFKSSGPQQRTMVGCGAAAGIAATFNAPIARPNSPLTLKLVTARRSVENLPVKKP